MVFDPSRIAQRKLAVMSPMTIATRHKKKQVRSTLSCSKGNSNDVSNFAAE